MIDLIAWIYMVRCSDGLYYVGSHRGQDPGVRVNQHNAGLDPKAFTYRRRPVEMVWAQSFPDAVSAIRVERQLKGWSRAKKEALIRGDWEAIQKLARNRQRKTEEGEGE